MKHSRLSRAVVLTLLLAVWAASTLGLVHATLHVPGDWTRTVEARRMAAAADATQGVHEAQAHASAARHGWLHALFGDRTDAECRLYDRLAHGSGALGVPLVLLPMQLPAARFAYLQGEAIVRWAAPFEARGPPVAR
ncbi:hypothetical protein SAMN05443579_101384 [Variovorax sp. PDC80]|uniref:hypothetical protein n=1 Tax=Variovorax sp. PDC80 TaxID=1882827 RepID=UPI0008F37575|nr:hypothetical protein [Variovorax sp. PDC80]SFO03758.1 hypothetical protein SAMN05443579_101384 [Variovorax sp. PDC80]